MFDAYPDLREAFRQFEESYTNRKEEGSKTVSESLKKTLNELDNIGYSRRELIFIFDIEPLTFDRWQSGGSMKPETFREFKKLVLNLLEEKPQHPINVSESGFVSWRYVFEKRQVMAERIWYISEGKFLMERSSDVQAAVNLLFSLSRQDKENQENSPILVYLYPSGGDTQTSLRQWKTKTEKESAAMFRGTVVGFGIQGGLLPWFQPGIRTIILEMPTERQYSIKLEGYLRIEIASPFQGNVLKALSIEDHSRHIQWLSVAPTELKEWHDTCKEMCERKVEECRKSQAESDKPFHVHMWQVLPTGEIVED